MDNQTIEALLSRNLSDISNLLNLLQKDAQAFLESDFDDDMLFNAMMIFGAIAKNIGYRRDIITDENIAEKVNNLLRVVEDWTGVSYPKY